MSRLDDDRLTILRLTQERDEARRKLAAAVRERNGLRDQLDGENHILAAAAKTTDDLAAELADLRALLSEVLSEFKLNRHWKTMSAQVTVGTFDRWMTPARIEAL